MGEDGAVAAVCGAEGRRMSTGGDVCRLCGRPSAVLGSVGGGSGADDEAERGDGGSCLGHIKGEILGTWLGSG